MTTERVRHGSFAHSAEDRVAYLEQAIETQRRAMQLLREAGGWAPGTRDPFAVWRQNLSLQRLVDDRTVSLETAHSELQFRTRHSDAISASSQALLVTRGDEAIFTTLQAILEATDDLFAYIGKNHNRHDPIPTAWVLRAGEKSDGDYEFTEFATTYDRLPGIQEPLQRFEPAILLASETEEPIRTSLESQGAHDVSGTPSSVGLGLAVARQLAGMMGGDVVDERSDLTTFRLELPTLESQVVESCLPKASGGLG
jgi:hypothetical protein